MAEDLIEQITHAFAEVSYPGDDDLVDAPYEEEPAAVAEAFRGRSDWRLLKPDFLNRVSDALSFFSDSAMRFYLAAYLIADIRDQLDWADPCVPLCSGLDVQSRDQKIAKAWGGGTLGEHAQQRLALFDDKQVSAIVAYLWWRLGTDEDDLGITEALENYWLEREAGSHG